LTKYFLFLYTIAGKIKGTDMNKKEISKMIKAIRDELGLTQEQFAHKLGVSFSTVNEWENNKRKPSPLAMRQIEILIKEIRNKK
jgi:DNA-binding transcriptional regulator YiaG